MDWYRWWHGSSTDPKFQMVAKECDIPLACVIGLWATLLEQASASSKRGSFVIDHEVMSFQLGIDTVTPCNAMKRRGLLHETDGLFHIANWEKRQPKRERDDNSTERVRKHRDNKKQTLTDDETHVTPCNDNETTETPRLDKRREEKESVAHARARDGNAQQPTKAGEVCKALRDVGIAKVNPSHPTLIALIESGVSVKEFVDVSATLADDKKTFAYILSVVRNRREDAARLRVVVNPYADSPVKPGDVYSDGEAIPDGWDWVWRKDGGKALYPANLVDVSSRLLDPQKAQEARKVGAL